MAIIAHEIPQEVGDFLILLHSGYSRARALAVNLLSSLATMVGGVLGYFALQRGRRLEATLLGIVAASMIYVAVADLIPGLHRRPAAARHRLPGAPDRAGHRRHRAGSRVLLAH